MKILYFHINNFRFVFLVLFIVALTTIRKKCKYVRKQLTSQPRLSRIALRNKLKLNLTRHFLGQFINMQQTNLNQTIFLTLPFRQAFGLVRPVTVSGYKPCLTLKVPPESTVGASAESPSSYCTKICLNVSFLFLLGDFTDGYLT